MKKHVKCWEIFTCNEKECPVYKLKELKCWLISGTHCRQEIQGKFIEKMEMCLDCVVFEANMDIIAMKDTLNLVNKQIKEFRTAITERDEELENISMELALGLSEAFEALNKVASGDPRARISEVSGSELIAKLKQTVNKTAEGIEAVVNQSHEFAIGLAEHFDVLNRVSKSDLSARISESSQDELLKALGKVTNHMIESVSREITERKKAEDRFKQVAESAGEWIWEVDANGLYTYSSHVVEKTLGYTPEEIVGKKYFYDFFEPGIMTQLKEEAFEVFYRKAPFKNSIYSNVHKNGRVVFLESSGTPVLDWRGNLLGYRGVDTDITERKWTEEALRYSKEKYRVVFETTGTAIVIIEDNIISMANTEFEKLSGYSKEEVEGKKSWTEFIMKEDLEKEKEYHNLCKLDPGAVPLTHEFKACDRYGNMKDIFMRIATIPTTKKIVASLLDITERKLAEEHLRKSLREKEILLRELHHRTKNNMQVISSLLDLHSITIDDKKMLQIIKEIQNRIRSIALVHEKLYQAKDLSDVNLKDYITDLIHALLVSYEGSKGRISLKADIDNIFLSLDTVTPCGLIISELVSNSLKYAFPDKKKGEITIECHSTDDSEMKLRISDNGIGLPDGLDFRNAKSLGFKLICKLAEDQLRGTVELEGGKGTAFLIKFREIKKRENIIEQ
jgi:PAS domain S-box-containing protein